jgi:hypothetical protein
MIGLTVPPTPPTRLSNEMLFAAVRESDVDAVDGSSTGT